MTTPVFESTFEMTEDIQKVGLHTIFRNLCELRFQKNLILNFEVTRSTLEQVFSQFAKH